MAKTPIVAAGRLRHRVQFQASEYVQNAAGEEIRSWVTYHSTRGSVTPNAARERWDADQTKSEVTHFVGIRTPFRKRIKTGDRMIYDGRVFEIEGVRDLQERRRITMLDCKENPDHTYEEP
jgi:SPP1 family predicted phage head-tail adaptor